MAYLNERKLHILYLKSYFAKIIHNMKEFKIQFSVKADSKNSINCDWYMYMYVPICMHVCVLSRFSCVLTLCEPMDCSPPGCPVMGFARQGYWSGLPFPPPRDLPSPGIELASFMSPPLAGGFFTTSATWEAYVYVYVCINEWARHIPHSYIFTQYSLIIFFSVPLC